MIMQRETIGAGDPLVLVPGGLTGWISWKGHAETLSVEYRVTRVQLLNVDLGLRGEPGFDSTGQFYHLPIRDTGRLAKCLRQRTIGLFLKLGLITQPFADNLLCWRHSGFSVDNSVRLDGGDHKALQAIAQYVALRRPEPGHRRPKPPFGHTMSAVPALPVIVEDHVRLYSRRDERHPSTCP